MIYWLWKVKSMCLISIASEPFQHALLTLRWHVFHKYFTNSNTTMIRGLFDLENVGQGQICNRFVVHPMMHYWHNVTCVAISMNWLLWQHIFRQFGLVTSIKVGQSSICITSMILKNGKMYCWPKLLRW